RDLGPRHLPLEGLVAPLDLRNELRDIILRRRTLRPNARAVLVIVAADEPDLAQELFGGIRRQVENGILLANLGGNHAATGFGLTCRTARSVPRPRSFARPVPGDTIVDIEGSTGFDRRTFYSLQAT